MKKILRKAAALLAAAAMLVSFGAMSVFAEASAEEWTDEDTAQLLEYLENTDNVLTSDSDLLTSGSDVSGSDILGFGGKKLRDYELTEKKFDEFGLSVLAPDFEMYADIYSDSARLSAALGTAATPDALFNISYGGNSNYIVYALSQSSGMQEDTNMMAVTYTESNWSRYIGSYAKLSAEEQERIAAETDLLGMGGNPAVFRVINGTPVLCQEYFDSEYSAMVYVCQTIVDGGIYELYLQIAQPGDEDFDKADEIINSLKINGTNPQRYGVASTTTTGWLIALVAVLFAIVALLVFFIIRFSMFAKASGSSFNIIGFNLPEKDQQ